MSEGVQFRIFSDDISVCSKMFCFEKHFCFDLDEKASQMMIHGNFSTSKCLRLKCFKLSSSISSKIMYPDDIRDLLVKNQLLSNFLERRFVDDAAFAHSFPDSWSEELMIVLYFLWVSSPLGFHYDSVVDILLENSKLSTAAFALRLLDSSFQKELLWLNPGIQVDIFRSSNELDKLVLQALCSEIPLWKSFVET